MITHGSDAQDQLNEYIDKPKKLFEKNYRQWAELGRKLMPMLQTAGWTEVLQPFLEGNGNPRKLFTLMRTGKAATAEGAFAAGKVEAYANILRFIDLLKAAMEAASREDRTKD